MFVYVRIYPVGTHDFMTVECMRKGWAGSTLFCLLSLFRLRAILIVKLKNIIALYE